LITSEKVISHKDLMGNFQCWLDETDSAVLKTELDSFLAESGYTVLNFVEHHFSPQGYTCLWLLAESHLAIHTFPENNASYLELTGCNKRMNEKFIQLITQRFTKH